MNLENKVITLKPNEIERLKKEYSSFVENSKNQYVNFIIKKDDSVITVYNSGKVVFNKPKLMKEITSLFEGDFKEGIGSDEVGTGDVFGPVVVCACFVGLEDYQLLKSLNVTDSKALTDEKIRKIGPIIVNKLKYSLLSLNNKKFNEITKKGYNLNKIKAILHNQAIINCQKKIGKKTYVVQDQFCEPSLYFRYLENENEVYRDIDFHTKGESYHLSVAAASIIARYAFLLKFDEICDYVGHELPKGAGLNVDQEIITLAKNHDLAYFSNIAKLNYNNFKKVGVIK